MVDPKTELTALLAELPEAAEERQRSAFAEQTQGRAKSLVLFGAGNLGRRTLAGLRRVGIEPLAFSDNNRERWGTTQDGVPILAPAEAAQRYGSSAAFVVTIWGAGQKHRLVDIRRQLQGQGCAVIVPFALLSWHYPDAFLPYLAIDVPQKVLRQRDRVLHAYEVLADRVSQDEFVAQVRWRLWLDFDGLPAPCPGPQYWPADVLAPRGQEIFIDCGAFDGDTIAELVHKRPESIGQIVAFEPDPANFVRLQEWVTHLPPELAGRIRIRQEAVGACRAMLRFGASGTAASAVGQGDHTVMCVALDEVLAAETPTYIKMDIEGSELDALHGARGVIGRALPVLAVCAYHCQDHLWEVPLAMAALGGSYGLYLRAHNLEGFDLVCYAVPPGRWAKTAPDAMD